MFPIDKLTYVLIFKDRVLTTVHTKQDVRKYLFGECEVKVKDLQNIKIDVYQGKNIVHSLFINDVKFLEEICKEYINTSGDSYLFIDFKEYKEEGI